MVYYNNYRYQWNLKKMTPIQYETAEKVHLKEKGKLVTYYM